MLIEPFPIASDFSKEVASEFILPRPTDTIADRMLMIAAQAREKMAADLTDAERVALVWATGGDLRQSLDGNSLTLKTDRPVAFFNDANGNIVVAYGPSASPPRG